MENFLREYLDPVGSDEEEWIGGESSDDSDFDWKNLDSDENVEAGTASSSETSADINEGNEQRMNGEKEHEDEQEDEQEHEDEQEDVHCRPGECYGWLVILTQTQKIQKLNQKLNQKKTRKCKSTQS